MEVFDFALTAAEMTAMNGLCRRNLRLIHEPGWVPHWDD